MRYPTALLPCLAVVFASLVGAQPPEFAHMLRNGDEATLSVFGPRPVDLAAKKLVDEFAVAINVEDPLYFYRDDMQNFWSSRAASSGPRSLIPRASLLEICFDLRPDGSLRDVRQLLRDLVETANAQSPFGYRIDSDGDVFTLVATRTRDEQGRRVDLTPILDRRVTIPRGTRTISEHVTLLTHELEEQTGIRMSCCRAIAENPPWGSTIASFEARDEPARSAFLRLVRSLPGRGRLTRTEPAGPYHLAPSEPGRYHWLMRCQPGESWCFISVAPIPEKR